MATTLEERRQRLDDVEKAVQDLRRAVDTFEGAPPPRRNAFWDALLEQNRREKAARRPLLDRVWAEIGIPADLPTIGAEKLQEMMLAAGVRPEECIASSEILQMREE